MPNEFARCVEARNALQRIVQQGIGDWILDPAKHSKDIMVQFVEALETLIELLCKPNLSATLRADFGDLALTLPTVRQKFERIINYVRTGDPKKGRFESRACGVYQIGDPMQWAANDAAALMLAAPKRIPTLGRVELIQKAAIEIVRQAEYGGCVRGAEGSSGKAYSLAKVNLGRAIREFAAAVNPLSLARPKRTLVAVHGWRDAGVLSSCLEQLYKVSDELLDQFGLGDWLPDQPLVQVTEGGQIGPVGPGVYKSVLPAGFDGMVDQLHVGVLKRCIQGLAECLAIEKQLEAASRLVSPSHLTIDSTADDLGSHSVERTANGTETAKPRRSRGRPGNSDANIKADKRVAEAWATKQYPTYDALGLELGITGDKVRQAVDRHRKRTERRTNSRQ